MKKNETTGTTGNARLYAGLYAGRQKDIGILLGLIAKRVRTHAQAAAENPENCGYVDDLGYVQARLNEIADFIREDDR